MLYVPKSIWKTHHCSKCIYCTSISSCGTQCALARVRYLMQCLHCSTVSLMILLRLARQAKCWFNFQQTPSDNMSAQPHQLPDLTTQWMYLIQQQPPAGRNHYTKQGTYSPVKLFFIHLCDCLADSRNNAIRSSKRANDLFASSLGHTTLNDDSSQTQLAYWLAESICSREYTNSIAPQSVGCIVSYYYKIAYNGGTHWAIIKPAKAKRVLVLDFGPADRHCSHL